MKASCNGWIHLRTASAVLAYPVRVLTLGPKWSRIQFKHKTQIGKRVYLAGNIKSRVPSWVIGGEPNKDAMVSTGGLHFALQRKGKS